MSDTLKPCPFCGAKAELHEDIDDCSRQLRYIVMCSYCEGEGYRDDSKAEAIRLWNQRGNREPGNGNA